MESMQKYVAQNCFFSVSLYMYEEKVDETKSSHSSKNMFSKSTVQVG